MKHLPRIISFPNSVWERTRTTRRGLGLVAFIALFVFSLPAQAQDTIRYLDRKTMKEAGSVGTIQEENPGGIIYKPGTAAGTRTLAALDISDVEYEVPGKVKLIYKSAANDERRAASPAAKDAERKGALTDAVNNYQAVLAELPREKFKFAERHLQFKLAKLQAQLAEDNPEQADVAIESLSSFVKKYADGWQIGQAAKLLARLQMKKGDADAARQTYEALAALDAIPKPVRQDCEFLIADALINSKKYTEAQKRLQGLLQGLAVDDPEAARARIYLAECLGASGKLQEGVTQLEAIIAKTTDKKLLGLAYNALGDCYRLNNRNKEALWPYLWVDVIYHQDRQEHQKAMEQLARLFDEQGDKARARQYRERLKRESR